MMTTTYDFLKQEAISHINSVNGIVSHLKDLYQTTGDEYAKQVLESLGLVLRTYAFTEQPATGKNLDNEKGRNPLVGPPEMEPKYFAPMKNLQVMLSDPWFDEACIDKKRFSVSWRNKLIEELMTSDCRDEVAKAWENSKLRWHVKGHVIGALVKSGVFLRKQYTPIARIYYGTREDTKESNTFAEYMGHYRRTYYGLWIFEYVTQPPIEK